MSFPFIVRQMSLPKRVIVLQGRSLPYQGATWGGTQRLDVNYFPGNPVAQTQVIGPTWKPTTITGMWKDIFLLDDRNRGILSNFPSLMPGAIAASAARGFSGGRTFASIGSIPSQNADLARSLRDAFTLMRKEGGLVQVEWGSLVRFGFISDDSFTHDREQDISYEIEFTWMGDTPAQPKFTLPIPDSLSLLKILLALLDKLINVLLTAVFAANKWLTRITQFIAKIGSFVSDLIEVLKKFAGFAFAPLSVIGNIRSALTSIRLANRDLLRELSLGQSAAIEAALTGNPMLIAVNALLETDVRAEAMALAAEAATQLNALLESGTQELLGAFTTPGGTTLRDISTRFYGTPDNWTVIAEFNGFSGSVVAAGVAVRIPAI